MLRIFYKIISNQKIPIDKDSIVINTPAFKYSIKEILMEYFFAVSATIKFATEPSNVKFPANVVAIPKISQPFSGEIKFGMKGR